MHNETYMNRRKDASTHRTPLAECRRHKRKWLHHATARQYKQKMVLEKEFKKVGRAVGDARSMPREGATMFTDKPNASGTPPPCSTPVRPRGNGGAKRQ